MVSILPSFRLTLRQAPSTFTQSKSMLLEKKEKFDKCWHKKCDKISVNNSMNDDYTQ